MAITTKTNIKTAQGKLNKFDMSHSHITTQDFMQIKPILCTEMVPGESISINIGTMCRMSPLVNPMYADVRIQNRAFFVPARTIMRGWNEFITDSVYSDRGVTKNIQKVPTFTDGDIIEMFTGNTKYATTANTASTYDFYAADVANAYKFTRDGRRVWDMLTSLGYNINLSRAAHGDVIEYSALPLLAVFKVWFDWYQYSPDLDTSVQTWFDYSDTVIGKDDLKDLFDRMINANYDKDYFTSAWLRPMSPNTKDTESNIRLTDTSVLPALTTNGQASVVTNYEGSSSSQMYTLGTAMIRKSDSAVSATVQSLTHYMLDALNSLHAYLKRHQLAGARVLDRYLAEYGITLENAKLDRSSYIGTDIVPVQVSDVMANSESNIDAGAEVVLGDYAGKGIGSNRSGNISFKTDEYGYFVVVSVIVPKIGYVQGTDRQNKHIGKLDFFHGDFDCLGVQALSRQELYGCALTKAEGEWYDSKVKASDIFGYTSRYAEYKRPMDVLSGDFKVNTLNGGSLTGGTLATWHLNRILPLTGSTAASANLAFSKGEYAQYDRVFNTSDNADNFYVVYHFNQTNYKPMKRLFDSFEDFEDCDGKTITTEINGTQLN